MPVAHVRSGFWRKRVVGALVALVLSGAGVFGLAAPATAAAPSDCGLGLHCSYSGYRYGNDFFQGPATHKFENCIDSMSIGLRSYRNIASSAYNNGRRDNSYLYRGVNQTGGRPFTLDPGMGTTDLGGFNDDVESGYFSSTLGSKGSTLCR